MTESTRLFWSRFALGLLGLAIALGVVALINPISELSHEIQRPESVDTPPLASLPRGQWPEHGLDAVERGIIWGQCESCGFPVTMEDVGNGFGDINLEHREVGFVRSRSYLRLPWGVFSCYRHTEEMIENE